jgi:hypothetical protein
MGSGKKERGKRVKNIEDKKLYGPVQCEESMVEPDGELHYCQYQMGHKGPHSWENVSQLKSFRGLASKHKKENERLKGYKGPPFFVPGAKKTGAEFPSVLYVVPCDEGDVVKSWDGYETYEGDEEDSTIAIYKLVSVCMVKKETKLVDLQGQPVLPTGEPLKVRRR